MRIRARYGSTCPICGKRIEEGDLVERSEGVEACHWRCCHPQDVICTCPYCWGSGCQGSSLDCVECLGTGWFVNPNDSEICKAGDVQGDPRTDKLCQFTEECCEFGESYQIPATVLYGTYRKWAGEGAVSFSFFLSYEDEGAVHPDKTFYGIRVKPSVPRYDYISHETGSR